jgi:hypothetical protein
MLAMTAFRKLMIKPAREHIVVFGEMQISRNDSAGRLPRARRAQFALARE